MSQNRKIIAIGPNPAWQKTLFFREFNFGEVNRAGKMTSFASGKGVNFSRAAIRWGKYSPLLMQFAGGETGRKLQAALDKEQLPHQTIQLESETRTCTTCLCKTSQAMTELIEPSSKLPESAINAFLDLLRRNVSDCSGIALCGTLPDNSSNRLYAAAAEIAKASDIPILIDSWKEIKPTLAIGGRIILKINAEEIRRLSGIEDTVEAINKMLTDYPLQAVAVTNGAECAYLADGKELWRFSLPRLEKIVNPLGSGDTASAVFFSELLAGKPLPQAFMSGLGAASANCLTAFCGSFDVGKAQQITAEIKPEKIN